MVEQNSGMIHYKSQRIWLDLESRIIMVEFDDNAALDLSDAKASTEAMIKVSNGEERPLLVDFSNLQSQTKECRDYYSKDPTHLKTYSAVAIVVSNPLSRVLANFFLGINKPLKPTRLFDEKAAAIEWLRQWC